MGQLARAFTAVRIAREGLADVTAEDEGPWSVVDLVETWALAPAFEGEAGARAIAVRDPHARLLVKEYSPEPETHSANGGGKISSMQLLKVLAGLDVELFAAEDEVAMERSEDYGTYVLVW
jgi:hypothetical protein